MAADFRPAVSACALRKDLRNDHGYALYMKEAINASPLVLGRGKTILLLGIKWDQTVPYDPSWLDIMSRAGAAYARLDETKWMIDGGHLSRQGKNALNDMKYSGILPVIKESDQDRMRIILEECPAPIFIRIHGDAGAIHCRFDQEEPFLLWTDHEK